ncbi:MULTISPECIES: hypothetical protein [Streptomyces]|uniref:Telomeric repeat-binding factor 2 n=1 Tax=Streptomyces chartreusis NRRL 3882 TaxID=1079985 RepID=A0A2N9BAN0_STRCX|nr:MULTISPECIES: hypothetical protein [Streptomyces]MYS91309.1 hypothetical protein [Streptomyces sp. SID5464]SOR80411.1 hypothetical protein SCNRRL3882_3866 [Streptomyces chartreusis NRRL 3882]
MRRTALATPALAAVLVGTQPASAQPAKGWEPAPSAPWDVGAGVRCDFPVHGQPVVDEVVRRVLSAYPDGSVRRVAYRGDLVVRVTNTETGASYDADASGSAVVEHRPDGSQLWTVLGPVLVGVGQDQGSLPRGLYLVDGVYTLDISPTGYKSVRLLHGTTDDLCARID